MEWVWLIVLLAGLGLLWLAIKGMEVLIQRMKLRDDTMKAEAADLERQIEFEEDNFIRVQAAKEFLAKGEYNPNASADAVPQEFKDAMSLLSGDEFMDAIVQNTFGEAKGNESIMASQSAFNPDPQKRVVSNGRSVLPVKARPSARDSLSKSEQKIYKKIKKGS